MRVHVRDGDDEVEVVVVVGIRVGGEAQLAAPAVAELAPEEVRDRHAVRLLVPEGLADPLELGQGRGRALDGLGRAECREHAHGVVSRPARRSCRRGPGRRRRRTPRRARTRRRPTSAANSGVTGAPPMTTFAPEPVALTASTAALMRGIVVVSSADMPTMSGSCFATASANARGRDVHAEVDDLDVGALPHHPDEVLADVVEVALDRADDRRVRRLEAGLREERLEQQEALLHGPGRDQHLGDEDLVALEALADDRHARDEAVLDDPARVLARVEALLGELDRGGPVAADHGRREGMRVVHRAASLGHARA